MRFFAAMDRGRLVGTFGVLGFTSCVIWAAAAAPSHVSAGLFAVLAVSTLVANLASSKWEGEILVSGGFVSIMLAAAFLGPTAALAVVLIAELGFWAVDRYRPAAFGMNLIGNGIPVLVAATGVHFFASAGGAGFYLLLGLMASVFLVLNYSIVATLSAILHNESVSKRLRGGIQILPALAINVVLTVAAAGIYRQIGLGAAVFMAASIFAFTYMARLVVTARDRAEKYASLSWGVLSGLIRTLDLRDGRAARHAAATAAFARDIAQTVGLSRGDCELAHTAGLLHDIGRFGLSDRVMERGRTLTEQDWDTIRKHPEMGEDLLRDLGVYGPVAQIVRAHHERVDGRGYPDRLKGDEIPEIAKIVAVAEVYDTLTADDTYRTPVSSFEALNELRRVSGSQLEGRYVEALSELLAGRGVNYRHADRADFDAELNVERRINEAAGGRSAVLDEAAGQ